MLLLTSTSDIVQITTGTAVSTIEVHASYVDLNAGVATPGRTNTKITTATTQTIVASPAASTQRNVKALYITNNNLATSCLIGVYHSDGTNTVELMQFILLPGENMGYREDGSWIHRDANGAEYDHSNGTGAFTGKNIPFLKTTTGSDAAGYWYCSSKDVGFPGAWVPGTPGVNGRATDGTTTADNGCLPITNPSVGANFITGLELASSVAHTHQFFDVLWVNTGLVVTTTTAQAITTPTLPARDVTGGTSGEGCTIALLFTTASTNAAAISNSTVSYTNSKGVAGKIATLTAIVGSQIPATPVIGTLIFFNLAAGDTGVQSIQSITLNTSLVTGSVSLMIIRDLGLLGTPIVNVSASKNIATPGIKIYNGSCILHSILSSATTTTLIAGSIAVMEK